MSPGMDFLTDHLWPMAVSSIFFFVVVALIGFLVFSLKNSRFANQANNFQNEDDEDKV